MASTRRNSRCSPLIEQRVQIASLLKSSLQEGESWYLISTKWFSNWKKYVGFDDQANMRDSRYPGCIDNSDLLRDDGKLRKNVVEELDYVIVPSAAWEKLSACFGVAANQQPIERKVVKHGVFAKSFKIELYLMDFNLGLLCHPGQGIKHEFSRTDIIGYIHWKMRKLFKVDPNRETRIWNRFMSNTYEQLGKHDITVHEASLYQGQVILLEIRERDGAWTRKKDPSGGFTESDLAKYKREEALQGEKMVSVMEGLHGDFATFLQQREAEYKQQGEMLSDSFNRFVYQAKVRFGEEEKSLNETQEELNERDRVLRQLETDYQQRSDTLEEESKKLNEEKVDFNKSCMEKEENFRKERREFREMCEKREKELSDKKEEIEKLEEGLETEKRQMLEVNKIQSNKIKLDVGGDLFSTSVTTLTKEADSMLAVMFSGRHPLKSDDDGSYFIDRDGTHFRYVLNYLRDGGVKEGTLPSDVQILKEIKNEAEYYQLEGLSKTTDDMITQLTEDTEEN